MEKYILSIDQGTTSTRAILFNHYGQAICITQKEVNCIFPNPGWVEVDANEIYQSAVDVIDQLFFKAKVTPASIECIGITNQRETTVMWDKETGMPVYNAIVWQSRQTADICEQHKKDEDVIRNKTGLIINPYFSASKIRYLLDHVPNGQARAEKGELICGTIDSWLIYKLTNHGVHATDVSNASRTMLFNINTMKWDEELCKLFRVPMKMLPKVYPSSYKYGLFEYKGKKIPITGVAGDQQAALFGQTCFDKGDCKNTYGTGCFMLLNTGNKPTFSKSGLLTTIAWQIGKEVTYALEGSIFVGGAVIQWLRDEMKMIPDSAASEKCAYHSLDKENNVYIVPAFVGLATPYWDNEARGAVFGLTRGTTRDEFVRAAIEAIAYQFKDVFEVMKKETDCSIHTLQVDGGATKNKYLLQFQSDICGLTIKLPQCLETTALGAAYLAGLCTGYYSSVEEIKSIHSFQAVYEPKMKSSVVNKKYRGWKLAVKATRVFKP
jgi:glycerol kinase